MPKLMEKKERMRTGTGEASLLGHVWRQHVVGMAGERILPLPATGSFDVIFVEIPNESESAGIGVQQTERKKPCVRDFIGYGAKFHKLRTTEEWMKELREGEAE